MATVVLQAVGTAVGGAVGGPLGAMLGRAAGALAGSVIDQRLFGPEDRTVSGPRLENAQILASSEGAGIPRAYGQVRIAGEIIWATHFKEVQSVETRSQGGKGGGGAKTTVKSYSYFANFAIALCEGEIATTRRIWVDGKELNQRKHTIRIYRGSEVQLPDGLIEAKQGADNAPAYRGVAYAVFENFPLEDFGNRIPQIAVEVVRPIGTVEKHIHAVNMIPGATEFGYDPKRVADRTSRVRTRTLNVNQTWADSDFEASLDELVAICPNLKQVALVVTWFGTDLRAGHCRIRPAVETASRKIVRGQEWGVAGLTRDQAERVTVIDGSPVYGGTPSDGSVLRAIAAIKARGLKVCLNPFVMMDIAPDNTLANPYGGTGQPALPWRGRITCDPAIGDAGSVDRTSQAADQISDFMGSGNDWAYRRMIRHYAQLAQSAGGVDMFIIGSEMRGLTSVRDQADAFPFVQALIGLSAEIAPLLGADCRVTYGADWSEYFGYHPQDGSGDVYFNLDPLWASDHIHAVGIDNYMPLSDWRAGGDPADVARSAIDIGVLQSNISGGEGYDWFYASADDRGEGIRTPITDGFGKPWVFRYKDLKNWWSQPHYERIGGVESAQPTAWMPQSKPFVFTEFGCPAVHNGPNQPNVFSDPKSSESALPNFSDGSRDDDAMLSYLAAHQQYWDEDGDGYVAGNNPISPRYAGRMVDFSACQVWAWDARPFPAFPENENLWSDAANWSVGHWLNGRLGSVRLRDLISALVSQSGVERCDVSQVEGTFDGYLLSSISSARDALEVLVNLFRLSAYEDGGELVFRSPGKDPVTLISPHDLVLEAEEPLTSETREQEVDLPGLARFRHLDLSIAYQDVETDAVRSGSGSVRQTQLSAPIVIDPSTAERTLQAWLQSLWTGRRKLQFAVPRGYANLTLGDLIAFEAGQSQRWRIDRIEDGSFLKVSAQAIEAVPQMTTAPSARRMPTSSVGTQSAPLVLFLDLPVLGSSSAQEANRIAVAADPWPGTIAVYSSQSQQDFGFRQSVDNNAFVGVTTTGLMPSVITSRWDRSQSVTVHLSTGTISAASPAAVLGGANAAAVRSNSGGWEVLQFQNAELVAERTWRLSGLLRGQAGTEMEAEAGAAAESDVVILNSAVRPVADATPDLGLELNWLVGPVGSKLDGPDFTREIHALGYRGMQPYRPVHLRAELGLQGDLSLTWTRRGRINADDWSAVEIPMSEESERYRVSIVSSTGSAFEAESSIPSFILSSSDLFTTFGNDGQTLTISVSQISNMVGPGPAAKTALDLN